MRHAACCIPSICFLEKWRSGVKFLSYRHNGADRIGILRGDSVADITDMTACVNLGEALRKLGSRTLCDLALRGAVTVPLEEIRYRPVVADPERIICVGLNYEEHRIEAGRAKTTRPSVFLRLRSSQTGHLEPIVLPMELPEGLDYEGEIAVVMGRGGRRIRAEQAGAHVFGYAPYNDASARAWQAHSTQWTAGKNFPCTGAFGPALVTADEVEGAVLRLTTRLNGKVLQDANTDMMIFPIPELIAYVSAFTELQPGDVIVTGTPGGVGFKRNPPVLMQDGDVIEVEVSGVGTLRNPVVRERL